MKIRNIIISLIVLFALTGIASAGYVVTLPVQDKEIPIGEEVTFDVILTTDPGVEGTLAWEVMDDAPISAKLSDEEFDESGEITVNTETLEPLTTILTVQTENGAVVGEIYEISITFCKEESCIDGGRVRASATGSVAPIPEVSTAVSTAIGLLGILGLIKFSKKN